MLWPDSIELDGQALELGDVAADVAIHHGREDIAGEPTAATCQLSLLGVDRDLVQAFRVGAELRVTAGDAGASSPRFTGRVTDATLAVDVLTAIAVGPLARARGFAVGLALWPVEPWSARVARIFTEAGLADVLELQADPDFDPQLAARDPATAGATTLGDYLAYLAPMIGAAVCDRPDGRILVQPLGARTIDRAVPLDPADVEHAPAWVMVLPGANVVTVRYTGDQSESVTLRDEASIGLYDEERPETIDTTFVDVADATARAQSRLDRGAYAHWNVLEAPILRGLELEVGAPVVLSSMPEASPADPWTPIVEGWAEQITGDAWTMQLALSDPRLSGIPPLAWEDVPALGYAWNAIDQAVAWFEAQSVESLNPARS